MVASEIYRYKTRRTKPQSGWVRVDSSAVRAVRYKESSGELDVRFEKGRQYRYRGVSRSKFRALLAAESVGAFINQEIKPHHSFREIIPSDLLHGKR
jgi:hypothetical protein